MCLQIIWLNHTKLTSSMRTEGNFNSHLSPCIIIPISSSEANPKMFEGLTSFAVGFKAG